MITVCGSSINARVTARRTLAPRRSALVARGPRVVRPASRGACAVRCMAGGDKVFLDIRGFGGKASPYKVIAP
eukprot:3758700-Pyramimonas_sp.AAC.2